MAGFPHLARSTDALLASPGQCPARIIQLVADGMSSGMLTGADYLSHHLRQRGLAWMSLFERPVAHHGLMNMRSLNSLVTDSSAASSSWGSGSRVVNGAVNMLPSGRGLTPLYALFGELGWKRGLVTTTEITHATPAGFATSVESRNSAEAIAAQYLQREIEVLLGGGQKFFDARQRSDKRDLRAEYAAQGYRVMDTAAALAQAPLDQRWLGIFTLSHLPYEIDHVADPQLRALVPTLPAMTRRALAWLGRHEHFILQIEGGRVDHAAHNCDAPAGLREMLAFDEALEVVLEFQRQHPDTLVVVSTDHGNGNPGINSSGSSYSQGHPAFMRCAEVNASFVEIMRRLRKQPPSPFSVAQEVVEVASPAPAGPPHLATVKEIQEILLDTTGYRVSERRAEWFRIFLERKGTPLYGVMNSELVQLGQLLANHTSVGWASGEHTADYVPVTAIGPGAEHFTGFVQNTDVFRHYTELAAIDYRNPSEPLTARHAPACDRGERVIEYAVA